MEQVSIDYLGQNLHHTVHNGNYKFFTILFQILMRKDISLSTEIPNITTILEEGLHLLTDSQQIKIRGPDAEVLKRAICKIEL